MITHQTTRQANTPRPHSCTTPYVKAAAGAWLRGRDYQADFDFARPDGADIGSVLDIRFAARRLRVHLDQAVEPESPCSPWKETSKLS